MKKVFLIALLTCPLFSQACSFAPGYERFIPSPARFEAKMDGNQIAELPAPKIGAVYVERGTAAPGGSCDDAGTLSVDIVWPKSSAYRIGEVGFYFRVVGGDQPDRIFPLEPISGKIVGQRARFFFVWLDGHPSSQRPLNLDVEVFAVNKGLEIGPSKRFIVNDRVR